MFTSRILFDSCVVASYFVYCYFTHKDRWVYKIWFISIDQISHQSEPAWLQDPGVSFLFKNQVVYVALNQIMINASY